MPLQGREMVFNPFSSGFFYLLRQIILSELLHQNITKEHQHQNQSVQSKFYQKTYNQEYQLKRNSNDLKRNTSPPPPPPLPPQKKMLQRLQILVAQVQAVEINRVKIIELIVLNTTCITTY